MDFRVLEDLCREVQEGGDEAKEVTVIGSTNMDLIYVVNV